MTLFRLDPIFESPLVLIVLSVLVLAVPWIVPVAGRSITPQQRRRLQWLRTGTAIVLLLAVFRPSIVRTDSVPTDATIAVLLDRSRSMALPADERTTRSELQNELFAQLLPAIGKLDQSLSLKTLTYSADAKEIAIDEQTTNSLAAPPTGNATDIARALDAAIQSSAGKPLAGVVLFGDGVDVLPPTDGTKPRARDTQAGARMLASLDVPLWTVAIGPPGDLGQVRDVEVAELAESYGLFSGNEAMVDFVVRSRALAGKAFAARVTMTREDGDSKPIELAVRSITPGSGEDSTAMSIPIVAPEPGRYQMEVRVDPQDGETLLSNNSQISFVDVRQGGGRVLYLEGQPRLEQSFLLQALRRFPDLQVSYRWIAADTKSKWPVDLGLTRNPNAFDVVIIGDLPADAIGAEQLSILGKRVGDGGALMMIGGIDTYAHGGYQSSPLSNVLPVKLDPKLSDFTGEVPLILTKTHPITTLAPSSSFQDQVDLWKSLPPMIGANQFSDIRVAPGIQVLLETPDADPMLVVGEYGAGRVAAFAGDSTWRWQRKGKSVEHRRFWRQMLLWLLNRDSDSSDALDINLAKRRAEVGQTIDYFVTSNFPSSDTTPSLSIIAADGTQTEIKPDIVVQGTETEGARLEGKIADLPPGMYRFRAAVPGDAANFTERSFQILDQDAELRQPFADHTYLSQLAGQTSASGGAMFLPEAVDELIDLITQLRRNAKAPVVQKYRLGDTPPSAWPLFIVLAALLGCEWYLRRRWGLA